MEQVRGRGMIAIGKRTNKSNKAKKLTALKSTKGRATKKIAVKKASKKSSKRKVTNKQISKTTATKANHKPEKNSAWKIRPQEHNSMQEVHVWKKGNSTFQFLEEVHYGHVLVVEKPDLSKYDPVVGVNVYEAFNVLES